MPAGAEEMRQDKAGVDPQHQWGPKLPEGHRVEQRWIRAGSMGRKPTMTSELGEQKDFWG